MWFITFKINSEESLKPFSTLSYCEENLADRVWKVCNIKWKTEMIFSPLFTQVFWAVLAGSGLTWASKVRPEWHRLSGLQRMKPGRISSSSIPLSRSFRFSPGPASSVSTSSLSRLRTSTVCCNNNQAAAESGSARMGPVSTRKKSSGFTKILTTKVRILLPVPGLGSFRLNFSGSEPEPAVETSV